MATFGFLTAVGFVFGSLTLVIFARPLTRWTKSHLR